MLNKTQRRSLSVTGFTLVEIVVGIVILAIALLVITGSLGPIYQRSIDPWHQVRAAELGHSLLNEIMARSFDQQSDRAGGQYRCGENGVSCTPCDSLGPEGETRTSFNDVDDFNNLTLNDSDILGSEDDLSLTSLYLGYSAAVFISCAGSDLNLPNEQVKKIQVIVGTPGGDQIEFFAYRGNW